MRSLLLGVVIVVVLVAFGALAGVYFALPGGTARQDILKEVGKAALQIIGVGVVGAGVKMLYDRTAEEMKRRNEVNEFRKDVLEKLVAPRLEVEQARRMFRLDGGAAPFEKYNEMLRTIVKQRVELGDTWHSVRTAQDVFSKPGPILAAIQTMKDYLDDLIDEKPAWMFRDGSMPEIGAEDAFARLSTLPKFKDFYEATEDSEFVKSFINSFEDASNAIRRDRWDGRATLSRPSTIV